MAMHDHHSLEPWRVLIVRSDGDEILLGGDAKARVLPQVVIPARQRIACNINRAVKRELGLRVVSLYEISGPDRKGLTCAPCQAVTALETSEDSPQHMSWETVDSLRHASLLNESDLAVVDRFISGLKVDRAELYSQPFLQPPWFGCVRNWVQQCLKPHSLRLTDFFEQFNASPTFSLIRFETDRAPVWFKAVGPPNLREFAVTCALARHCARFVPRILAANLAWNAWLAEDVPGTPLSASSSDWENAAASLARLQIQILSHVEDLRKAGARNLRFPGLHSWVEPFFGFVSENIGRFQPMGTGSVDRFDPKLMITSVHDSLSALESLGLPETIGHMDLSPQNLFCTADRCIFLDWAESFVGCPFFSFEYLLQQFRQNCVLNAASEQSFRTAYFTPWQTILSASDTDKTVPLIPMAALFAYAATLWSSLDAQAALSESQGNYLIGLARKMHRLATKARGVHA